jgi:hypothetical protein
VQTVNVVFLMLAHAKLRQSRLRQHRKDATSDLLQFTLRRKVA